MAAKRYDKPKRFAASLSEPAYARLRALAERYDLGNNYTLIVLLERLDQLATPEQLDAAFRDWIASNT